MVVPDTSIDWLAPITPFEPCGKDLEYDHDFLALFAAAVPKEEVQYGAFIAPPEPVSWKEVEHSCLALMRRSTDIRLATLYARCRVQRAGLKGLVEALTLLATWLHAFPRTIHPSAERDSHEEETRAIRLNALEALVDPEGLLGDIRDLMLNMKGSGAVRLRDLERAEPAAVQAAIAGLGKDGEGLSQQAADALIQLTVISDWAVSYLGSSVLDVSELARALQILDSDYYNMHSLRAGSTSVVSSLQMTQRETETYHGQNTLLPQDRLAAGALIRTAREWFEVNEPSSPVAVLLMRAEALIGKSYREVVQAVPPELLTQLENTPPG